MIVTLIDEVRPKTIRLLESASEAELLWAPVGTQNHIIWHAGHAVWLTGELCIKPIIGTSELPEGWPEVFGQDGTPPARTTTWPQKQVLINELRHQQPRMRALVESLGDAQLANIDSRGATLARRIIHGLHDEANHQGEMYLLLKMQRT